jgi:hypothetical protein
MGKKRKATRRPDFATDWFIPNVRWPEADLLNSQPLPPSLNFPAFKAEQDAKFQPLKQVLDQALAQTQSGKGRERHNPAGDQPFLDQQIVRFGDWMGSNHFQVGQAVKKAIESTKLPKERARAELLGAIVYLGAAILMLDRLPERDPQAPTPPKETK